ncbi:xanthine dehydrogenase family protein molybdopterin-binding subunit [Oxalobacteraceae sp. CFBP 8755]|jgi:xanthine dehydrogenase YagR molybdenum-binding subunit|nr:xanthine dehydrogenase family protein molybdopterin-binding subunit [Oxalobacteraceae sp. CFBP 8761]MBD8627512.1 xanthine dehydrogenase family protein molybdopterin-binding subunit [Oxalobacteraceae sp. CFBP 8753]MBD8631955.1 xanthine dehydrogenase family protein molybdopterin-binding subunit [Oxalobacteraceae sp. CFBP 8755]MBD8726159.1 xanthine dehydrogenase family protein molybdopterin-binding subunit [Oxalobacteraceae sp. CFBP 13708]
MKFLTPATTNPIDRMRYVGQPTNRIDGKLKTTGTAPYAYEHHKEVPNAAQGFVVGSGIAKGRIASIDIEAARRAPGVLAVVTAENAGKLGKGDMNTAHLLAGPNIQHYHQAVALVVAETFEQARAAAGLVKVNYTVQKGRFDLDAEKGNAVKPTGEQDPPDTKTGNFARGFETSPVKLDATYHTPDQSHAMMEPHASTAFWEGDKVTVYTSNQMIAWCRSDLAKTLAIPKEKVRVVSPYVGGGFGSKLFLRADALLAALGARAAKRPVKVSLHRHLIFNNTTHRPATIQRIRIGAGRDGRIMAIGHETWNGNLPKGSAEVATAQTRLLYAGADRMTTTRVAELDLPEGNAMRAPGEAPGMMALEVAMDEMAEKLNMDPVQFRILNDTKVDPEKPIRKFSERRYIECMRMGADKFGWAKRNAKPGQVREGRWLIGHGVASAFRNSPVMKSGARVKLGTDGRVTVETDMTDIGTGSYTIIAQTTAEMLGVPLDRIDVRLGDSDFPASSGSGGQWGANSATSGVYAACVKLREQVAAKLGVKEADAEFVDGTVRVGGNSQPLIKAAAGGELVGEDTIEFTGGLDKKNQLSTFGAHFVEVAVDSVTGETRVRRMLAVCAAGRILNPMQARSQVIGGMTMGIGGALMEHLVVDKRLGFFANHDMATYEVPVHADVPHQEVIFLKEEDEISSPMKAKGIGELGLCGVAAAVANAIYNATGVRVREYPITLDKLIEKMPLSV